jgi:hypothetical protein
MAVLGTLLSLSLLVDVASASILSLHDGVWVFWMEDTPLFTVSLSCP